jgi:hypothetical protein
MAQPSSGVGHQYIHRSALGGCVKLIDAFRGSEVDVEGLNGTPALFTSQLLGRVVNLGLVGSYQQIIAFTGTEPREFEADTG